MSTFKHRHRQLKALQSMQVAQSRADQEQWLKDEVVPSIKAVQAGHAKLLTPAQMRAHLVELREADAPVSTRLAQVA